MAQIISAGPFRTHGEKRTAEEFKKNLPPDWIVICNKLLFAEDRDYDLDFIVIADKLIFLLEEKGWWGKITGTDQQWVLADGSTQPNPLSKVKYAAKLLADQLREAIPELKLDHYFLFAGVILSSAKTLPRLTRGSLMSGSIFLLLDVCQRLTELDRTHPSLVREGLIKGLRPEICKYLYNLPALPETPAHINDIYTIEDATDVRPGVRLLRARLVDSGEPRILMLYDLSREPTTSRENLRLSYLREFRALQELRKTGYVPEVKDPFAWSQKNEFLVLPIVPPEGKSLPAYPFPVSIPELINELYLAAEAFKALGTIHQHGVLHRAINPGAIYIRQNSAPFGLVFTNFFAARAGVPSIKAYLDAQKIEDPYIAPELSAGYGNAKEHTDVFSLALVFLERWSGQPLEVLRHEVNQSVVLPDLQARWSALRASAAARLNELFHSIFYSQMNPPRLRSIDVTERLEEIARILVE